MPITQNVRVTLVCMCMRREKQGVCVHSHMISLLREAIFHPYHSNIDKEDARPLCFTSTHVVPAESKVHLKEWMSERSKSTSAWMGSLFSQALLLYWQEDKSLITPPCDGAHTLCGHAPSGQMMMSALRWPEISAVLAWTWAITSLAVPVTVMNV